jgi:hypothetical protein
MSANNTAVVSAKPKQFLVGISESTKASVNEAREDFTRPPANPTADPVMATEKEMIEIIWTVASDRRFKTIEEMDDQGFVSQSTVDLFSQVWETIKARDYSTTRMAKVKLDTPEAIQDEINRLLARQAKLQALNIQG